ncbi:helix-turn-helix domain-containing protein [Paenibacillus sp. NRS-1783]|uniref:helix-turn-helix domain-containing protein n=1 Tax=Paenibacillus sp. NRS-1783 TaxID=3233907 RepID=UPI003D275A41
MLLHENIRELRKSKGMTQTYVAGEVGLSIQSYNMKERGERVITALELSKIAAVLNVSMDYFFEKKIHVKCNESDTTKEVG